MKKVLGLGLLLGVAVVTITAIEAAEQQQQPLQKPEWAYGVPRPRRSGPPAGA
jgi:hypothetical protein